jgi:hypothetical protein
MHRTWVLLPLRRRKWLLSELLVGRAFGCTDSDGAMASHLELLHQSGKEMKMFSVSQYVRWTDAVDEAARHIHAFLNARQPRTHIHSSRQHRGLKHRYGPESSVDLNLNPQGHGKLVLYVTDH